MEFSLLEQQRAKQAPLSFVQATSMAKYGFSLQEGLQGVLAALVDLAKIVEFAHDFFPKSSREASKNIQFFQAYSCS